MRYWGCSMEVDEKFQLLLRQVQYAVVPKSDSGFTLSGVRSVKAGKPVSLWESLKTVVKALL